MKLNNYKLFYQDNTGYRHVIYVKAKNAQAVIHWFYDKLYSDGYKYIACSTNYPKSIIRKIFAWLTAVRIK